MANATLYAQGDLLSLTDLNGKVYRVKINSISDYTVTHQLANVEILAQSYPPPNDTVNTDNTLFYICSNVPGDTAEFTNLVLWDQILDTSKTVYLTGKIVLRLDILPTPIVSGQPVRDAASIIASIKKAISDNVRDATVGYTDITNEADNELEMMKAAVNTAFGFFDEVKELESIRPLIQDLKSIDFENLTTETQNLISSIQARLAVIDAGGASLTTNETQ